MNVFLQNLLRLCSSHLLKIQDFIKSTVVWTEFAARYFTLNEISVMLEVIMKRITPEKVCFELPVCGLVFVHKN